MAIDQKFAQSNDHHNLSGKSALIVGGTQGIGLGIAKVLARRGASITVAGRNKVSGDKAINQIKEESTSEGRTFRFTPVDLESNKDVERFASQFSKNEFDFIIWSAGIFPSGPRRETNEGIELAFQVNYLSRYVGYQLLIPCLKDGGRLLTINAPFVDNTFDRFQPQVDVDDFEFKKPDRFESTQANIFNITGCLYNDYLVIHLANQHPTKFFAHGHPGYVPTNLLDNSGVDRKVLGGIFTNVKFTQRTAEEYGEIATYILTDEELGKKNGLLFDQDANVLKQSEFEKNVNGSEKLFEYSKKLTGL
ncbi:Wwox [Acrasis kona]|uniref:Wwox n=1 Tax=Acrasis kona TaxID=1008807 RepID=A0AAW2YTN8_9EUKA